MEFVITTGSEKLMTLQGAGGQGAGGRGELRTAAALPRMASEFRELVAYRHAIALANELHRDIAGWPSFERWSVGIQLLRSVDSIGANIAESAGRWHRADE